MRTLQLLRVLLCATRMLKYVQFYRRDSRSVDKAQPRLEKKLNPKIKYYKVNYHCIINGGKKHISKATGAREGR